jgi:hypothetical protein
MPTGSTTRPTQPALACTTLARHTLEVRARHRFPTMVEKRGSSFRAGKETACACEKDKKDNSPTLTTPIRATLSTCLVRSQGQTQLSLHGEISVSSYKAGLTQQDLAKRIWQSRVLHVVLAHKAGSITVFEQHPVRLSDVHRQSPSESRNSGLAALNVVSMLHSAERVDPLPPTIQGHQRTGRSRTPPKQQPGSVSAA